MDRRCWRPSDAAAGRVHACHHLALTESSDILGRWRSCFVIEELSSSVLPLRHVRREVWCIPMRSCRHAVGLPGFTRVCRLSPSHDGGIESGHELLTHLNVWNRGREARPKCQIRYNLSCGCAVTVLPPVAPQLYEIYDSSLCFYGLSLERISSPSSKWKGSSLPCANGSTACRKTLGKNLSWLTKGTPATRALRGKVFG